MPSFKIIYRSIIGELIKLSYKAGLLAIPYGVNQSNKKDRPLIVSLTSYGRRVKLLAPLTIASIMRQTIKPDKIILWLDKDNWNQDNLPKNLRKLEAKGLEIRFCDDLKSYKKLIPTLQTYPESLVLTVDDDIYYESTVIEELLSAYSNNPQSIHAFLTSTLKFDVMNNPGEYWCGEGRPARFDFATGVGAILYDPRLLFSDVTDISLFEKLCPMADDLWFYFMEFLKGTHVNMVRPYKTKMNYYPLDSFYQRLHKTSSLNASNLHGGQNNVQIKNIMEHYGIKTEDLRQFSNSNPNLRKNEE